MELAVTLLEDTVSVCGGGVGVGGDVWRMKVHSVCVLTVRVCGVRVCE